MHTLLRRSATCYRKKRGCAFKKRYDKCSSPIQLPNHQRYFYSLRECHCIENQQLNQRNGAASLWCGSLAMLWVRGHNTRAKSPFPRLLYPRQHSHSIFPLTANTRRGMLVQMWFKLRLFARPRFMFRTQACFLTRSSLLKVPQKPRFSIPTKCTDGLPLRCRRVFGALIPFIIHYPYPAEYHSGTLLGRYFTMIMPFLLLDISLWRIVTNSAELIRVLSVFSMTARNSDVVAFVELHTSIGYQLTGGRTSWLCLWASGNRIRVKERQKALIRATRDVDHHEGANIPKVDSSNKFLQLIRQ